MEKLRLESVEERNGKIVGISSESPFYPDGKGGQLGDRGLIGGVRVLGVFERGGKVHHVLERRLEPGEYEFEIDLKRREEIARQHTAQHVLSAAFLKVAEIDTLSFHMGEEYSTVDLGVEILLDDVVLEVENMANEIVLQDRPVKIQIFDREELEGMPLRKPVSPKVRGPVRVVEIEGFDLSACGGFHVSRTGQIGCVKIIDWEKVKGSMTRVYFVAGMRALRSFQKLVSRFKDLSRILTSSVDEMPSRVSNLISDVRECRSKLERVSRDLAGRILEDLVSDAVEVGGIKILIYEGPEELREHVLKNGLELKDTLVIAKSEGGYDLASSVLNVGELVKELKESLGGRGGGGEKRGRLKVEVPIEEFMKALINILEGEIDGRG